MEHIEHLKNAAYELHAVGIKDVILPKPPDCLRIEVVSEASNNQLSLGTMPFVNPSVPAQLYRFAGVTFYFQ